MPLIILGLIVILGGCLLIYYQLGPKVTQRLGKRFGGWASGAGASDDGASADPRDDDPETRTADREASDWKETGKESDKDAGKDKVLFLFGSGERVERPIGGDDKEDGA